MKYAKPAFKKRHEIDKMRRMVAEQPRWMKGREKMQSTAWKNHFYRQQETNDIRNEINRMQGMVDHMILPVGNLYFRMERLAQEHKMKESLEAKRKELRDFEQPPPFMTY